MKRRQRAYQLVDDPESAVTIAFVGSCADSSQAMRIGLMGFNSRPNCVVQVLAALEQCLARQGAKVAPGAGVAAAGKAYAEI